MMDIEQVIEEHGDYLLKVAYLYVKNKATAEDIVQDVFIAFYQKQEQFRQQASLRTYLVKMTVNRSHDYLRSWKSKRLTLFEKISAAQRRLHQRRKCSRSRSNKS
ncbi:sigma-70 family RNA polymerase sigma factor [Lysinibacillus fusiformis]